MEINLILKTEAEYQVHVLVAESISGRGQGRGTGPGTKGDLGKEQSGSRRDPSKARGKVGRSHEAWEVHISAVKRLHLVGVMGNT